MYVNLNKNSVLTCGLRLYKLFKMEGFVIANSGEMIPVANITQNTPPKAVPFMGITPIKERNYDSPVKKTFRVSIEGNIGAGKSTLIEYFRNTPIVETYPEPINWWRNLNGHNLLDLLYTDINKWVSTFQSYVQLSRLRIQTSKPEKPDTAVQIFERSVQNNRFCFMEQAHAAGFLHGADYAILDKWYRWIYANVDIRLDLIVYLRTSPEVVYERVKSRGRPEEDSLSLEYLQQLHTAHEQWLMSKNEKFNTIPVLVLDANLGMDEMKKQYKEHESVILGCDARGLKRVEPGEPERVKKVLKLD